MRMLLHAEVSGRAVQHAGPQGRAGKILRRIVEDLKPEAAYFTEEQGQRSALLVVDLPSSSDVPRFAEPFFLSFNAVVTSRWS
ncbi:MAG: hypothetical protein R3D30_11490 [Hyphomicrobiales bacterium]